MAKKYELVASYYDGRTFKDQTVLEGTPTILHEIDYITCIYPSVSYFLNLLDKDGTISGKNHLAIRFIKNKEYHYIQPLFNYPEMQDIIPRLQEKNVYLDGQRHYFLGVPVEHPLYKEKLREFYSWVKDSPELFFSIIYGNNYPKKLDRLVSLYLEGRTSSFSKLEDERAYLDNKSLLELEFSRYKTFRGYLIRTNQYKMEHPDKFPALEDTSISYSEKEEVVEYDSSDDEFLEPEEIQNAVGEGEVWYRVK
ncbi:MAG: hypothetical protein E7168_02415 [Firmicutes bacterium]|nr:hypothetical protein [Bacillota bacterium]